MSKVITFTLCLLLCFSCKESTSENQAAHQKNEGPAVKSDTTKQATETILDAIEVIDGIATKQNDYESIIRPNYFEFKGKIDDKYEIYLYFDYEGDSYNDALKKHSKIYINGRYKYTTSQKSMKLSGQLDPKSQRITLERRKQNVVDEVFSGKYTKGFSEITGTWEKVRKGKKLSFSLTQLPPPPNKASKLFAAVIHRLTYENEAEQIGTRGVGVDNNGIFFRKIYAPRLDYKLSNNFFTGSSSYDQDGNETYLRMSDYDIDIQIIPIEDNNSFIVVADDVYESYESEGKDDDLTETSSKESTYEIWMLIDGIPTNIFLKNKDAKTDLDYKAYLIKEKLFFTDIRNNKSWEVPR